MTIRLFAGFSTYDTGLPAGTVKPYVPSPFNTWTFNHGQFFIPFSMEENWLQISGACDTLAQQLTDAVGFPATYTCYYDNQLNRVVLSSSIQNDQITFNSIAQSIFGFSSSYSTWRMITGSIPPSFVFSATQLERAKDTEVYEQDAFISEKRADNGKLYSIGRLSPSKRRDWTFLNEPKENVFNIFASGTIYTWERFVKDIRKSSMPYVLIQDVNNKQLLSAEDREAVYILDAESVGFKPQQLYPDYEELWNIPIRNLVFFEKHRDEKAYPPGSVCQLPGIITNINPTNGELLFFAPDELVWSSDFDYSGSNPNKYIVYIKKDSPSFSTFPQYYPLTKSSQSLAATHKTGGNWYWRIVGYNQCGSRVSEIFNYQTVGASLSQSTITTDLAPYLFASGSGQAFSGTFTNHTFDFYDRNEPRDIASKVNQDGNWIIVESNIANAFREHDLFSMIDNSSYLTNIEDYYSTSFPINTFGNYDAKACEILVTSSFAEIDYTGSFELSKKGGLPSTFSIIAKIRPASNGIVGFRLKDPSDDLNIYFGIKLSNGSASLGDANSSYGFTEAASGSIIFSDDTGERWAYCWLKYVPTNYLVGSLLAIYPCASTGSIEGTWNLPIPNDPKVTLAFPQLIQLNESALTRHSNKLVQCNAMIPASRSFGFNKPIDRISGSFLPNFVASGSAMKIRLVTSYSSSHSPIDRPIINFSGTIDGLKFKQLNPSLTASSNLRAEMNTNSGSFTGSWQLGFAPGEKIDLVVDHDYSRVDWYQTNGYQNHFYFSGSWRDRVNQLFFLGSSGSSNVIAFDGLMNISLTSSNPNAPMPPTGSNVEDELIAESIMWFDAAKGVTLSGAYLQTWNDQSPRGMFASRSAAAVTNNAGEYLLTGGVGNEPAVRMANNGEYLVTGSMFDFATNPTVDDITFYIIHNNTSPSGNLQNYYHFDQAGSTGLGVARRVIYQQQGAFKRLGLAISGSVHVYGPTYNWNEFATGSQCLTFVLSGTQPVAVGNFVHPKPMWWRGRGLWGSTNVVINGSATGSFSNTKFALFGDVSATVVSVRTIADYSLFIAFSGSHNQQQRERVWDYLENRFGICNSTIEYAFTSASSTGPWSQTSGSIIPSSLIDSRFWNGNYKIKVKLGTDFLSATNTIYSVAGNTGNQRLITVAPNGTVRWYPDTGGTFLNLGILSGSNVGDIVEIHLPNLYGTPGIYNITQNKAVHFNTTTGSYNQTSGSLQWLLQGVSATQGLSGTGWEVWAPEFVRYDME